MTAGRRTVPGPAPSRSSSPANSTSRPSTRCRRRIEAAEAGSPPLLVIDLSRLEFVDSSGVRLALLADDRARAAGRRVAVRLGTGHALRVFQALGLLDKLDVVPLSAPDDATVDGASR